MVDCWKLWQTDIHDRLSKSMTDCWKSWQTDKNHDRLLTPMTDCWHLWHICFSKHYEAIWEETGNWKLTVRVLESDEECSAQFYTQVRQSTTATVKREGRGKAADTSDRSLTTYFTGRRLAIALTLSAISPASTDALTVMDTMQRSTLMTDTTHTWNIPSILVTLITHIVSVNTCHIGKTFIPYAIQVGFLLHVINITFLKHQQYRQDFCTHLFKLDRKNKYKSCYRYNIIDTFDNVTCHSKPT